MYFSDVDDHFKNTKQVFEDLMIPHHTEEDCRIAQHVCCLISTRAAYLASAGINIYIYLYKSILSRLHLPETLFIYMNVFIY